ncbi:Ubiquinol-cytochrome C reductase, UQCRX/QCR9 like protein, partial [Ostertagia ostertagi]
HVGWILGIPENHSTISTLFLAASFGAFFMNYTFDVLTDTYWDKVNAGKQWKDIKAKLENPQ